MSSHARAPYLSPWGRLVTVSAVLVAAALLLLLVLDLTSREQRVVTYPVRGSLTSVSLDLGDADVVIARGGRNDEVAISRTERFAFGHDAITRRLVDQGVFRLRSRCPATVLHSCAVSYRVTVPDNVPIDVRTTAGSVRLDGYRGSAQVSTNGGDIHVAGFCGFRLQARAVGGSVLAGASCPLQQLSLRSTTGSVHAIVPAGRYRLDAQTASGSRSVHGVSESADAPFALQALSSSGDVTVEGRS